MDSKQAAATLRAIEKAVLEFRNIDVPMVDVAMAAERGAEAIEMLEWLFAPDGKNYRLRLWALHQDWDGSGDFLTYCEARFRECAR